MNASKDPSALALASFKAHFSPAPVRTREVLFGSLALFCLWLLPLSSVGQAAEVAYRPDRILVQPKPKVSLATLAGFHSARRAEVLHTFPAIGRLQVLHVPAGETVQTLIQRYNQSGLVDFAEPDYLVHAAITAPNDPKYLDGTLWGLNNYGQSGGTPHVDIDASRAWDVLTSASNIVVAVLDTGVRFTHEDLAANMWVNPNDGGHGFNAFSPANSPSDDQGHGTLISGVLGGVGNNGTGVVGVAWQVQIMACKCLDSSGNGFDSTVVQCIDYAVTNGARVINGSFDSPDFSQSLSNAIARARDAGVIFVASAGNNAANVDLVPRYPACYKIDNIVSVAYITRSNTLGTLSNYGATNVTLAAPGAGMYSTFFLSDSSYLGNPALQGTSFAAPYVTGAMALMLAKYPSEDYRQIISRVVNATDPVPALAGKCATGGRLNLRKALSPPIYLSVAPSTAGESLHWRVAGGPNRTCVLERTMDLITWLPISTNTTSMDGTFDFIDEPSTDLRPRFYCAVSW